MRWGTVLAAIGGAVLLAYLYVFDPARGGYPGCPFRFLTGWHCPGCGSQRCVHHLLHGRWSESWSNNALLLVALPLAALHAALAQWGGSWFDAHKRRMAWWAWLTIVLTWGIWRNLV